VLSVGFALVLIPLSFWYAIGAISVLDYKAHVLNALPIPFVLEFLSAALGLVLMTWGMIALWWLVFKHERSSLRQIALPWWIGLIGGTSIAVYWLARLSASNGRNDEFVFVPPLLFVIVFKAILLVRMSFNSAGTTKYVFCNHNSVRTDVVPKRCFRRSHCSPKGRVAPPKAP
jgi:NhaP-type Na+/H+ or K+/H+ antiporter